MTRYNAEIYVGSLLPRESRSIAALLLLDPDQQAWLQAMVTDNILQKRTPATAVRQARLLRRRLATLDAEGWKMIAERESKEIEKFRKKHVELLAYDEQLRQHADKRIVLDPDDGVKVNHGKFGTLLADVKAITGGASDD